MKKLMYAVRDIKADAFMNPFPVNTPGMAERAFTDVVNDPNQPLHKHPADYQLFEVGSFDEDTGLVAPIMEGDKPCAPRLLVTALQVIKKE